MLIYMVRIRDALLGCDRWVDLTEGRHFQCRDRKIADWVALAWSRFEPTCYAYVVEVDPRCENVI